MNERWIIEQLQNELGILLYELTKYQPFGFQNFQIDLSHFLPRSTTAFTSLTAIPPPGTSMLTASAVTSKNKSRVKIPLISSLHFLPPVCVSPNSASNSTITRFPLL